MARIRENSWCCGAGGGVRTFEPEFATWAAGQRAEEALSTGAEALVTSCPWCEQNLTDGSENRIPIYDIAELLLGIIGDADCGDAALGLDPLMGGGVVSVGRNHAGEC